jgi:hypothetical protein
LSFVIRSKAIDEKRDAQYWTVLGYAWLRTQQFNPSNLQINSFTTAVISHGDILYAPLDHFPFGLRFGLTGFTSPQYVPGAGASCSRAGEC